MRYGVSRGSGGRCFDGRTAGREKVTSEQYPQIVTSQQRIGYLGCRQYAKTEISDRVDLIGKDRARLNLTLQISGKEAECVFTR